MTVLLWSIILALVVVIVLLYAYTVRLLKKMEGMLDAAGEDTFSEKTFDESRFSRLESRMYRYLVSGATAKRQLSAEKDGVKALVSDISHQTKTPIANILLYTQLLGEDASLTKEAGEIVGQIERQTEKLSFLIQSLVKTSRLESGILAVQPKKNHVGKLLLLAEEQFLAAAEAKDIVLDVSAPEEIYANFDAKWTLEAVENLLDNAVKYTPAGGRITVGAACYELFVRIDIQDTGLGISEEAIPKIFQRFYRSPAVAEEAGVGIGLYLVREIVMRQGGYLKVTSVPGKGSAFSVFLPR